MYLLHRGDTNDLTNFTGDSLTTSGFATDLGSDGKIGHGDYTVLIPYLESETGYDGQYLYLYSAFSNTEGGFEESGT